MPVRLKEAPPRLPRGRHGLSKDEVSTTQRTRMLAAAADLMSRQGYGSTSVADIIAAAGVSRETFYQQFSCKLDCFLGAFDLAASKLTCDLRRAIGGPGTTRERFERALDVYLTDLADHPAYARLFLVEVFAAGPEAFARRIGIQEEIVEGLAALVRNGAESAEGAEGAESTENTGGTNGSETTFACEMIVAAVSSMVTSALVARDTGALRALRAPVMRLVDRILGPA